MQKGMKVLKKKKRPALLSILAALCFHIAAKLSFAGSDIAKIITTISNTIFFGKKYVKKR